MRMTAALLILAMTGISACGDDKKRQPRQEGVAEGADPDTGATPEARPPRESNPEELAPQGDQGQPAAEAPPTDAPATGDPIVGDAPNPLAEGPAAPTPGSTPGVEIDTDGADLNARVLEILLAAEALPDRVRLTQESACASEPEGVTIVAREGVVEMAATEDPWTWETTRGGESTDVLGVTVHFASPVSCTLTAEYLNEGGGSMSERDDPRGSDDARDDIPPPSTDIFEDDRRPRSRPSTPLGGLIGGILDFFGSI